MRKISQLFEKTFTFILCFLYIGSKIGIRRFREKNHNVGGVYMVSSILKGIGMVALAVLFPLYPFFILGLFVLAPIGFIIRAIDTYANPHHLDSGNRHGI